MDLKKYLLGFTWALVCIGSDFTLSASDCSSYDNYSCCNSLFDGFYVGGNVGFATYSTQRHDLDNYYNGFFNVPGARSSTATNVVAGIQVGYDYVCCNRVLGLVADWSWSEAKTFLRLNPNSPIPVNQFIDARLRWFTTLRARGGLTLKNALVYVTGGAVVGDFRTKLHNQIVAPIDGINVNETHNFKHHRWGWVAGIGTEFAFWCKWSVNAEILYMRFRSQNITFNSSLVGVIPFHNTRYSFKFEDAVWVGRLGLNYRFSICDIW